MYEGESAQMRYKLTIVIYLDDKMHAVFVAHYSTTRHTGMVT